MKRNIKKPEDLKALSETQERRPKMGRPRLGAEPSELVSLRFPGETIRKMTERYGSPEEALRALVEENL